MTCFIPLLVPGFHCILERNRCGDERNPVSARCAHGVQMVRLEKRRAGLRVHSVVRSDFVSHLDPTLNADEGIDPIFSFPFSFIIRTI